MTTHEHGEPMPCHPDVDLFPLLTVALDPALPYMLGCRLLRVAPLPPGA
jgi:hypothetical protein